MHEFRAQHVAKSYTEWKHLKHKYGIVPLFESYHITVAILYLSIIFKELVEAYWSYFPISLRYVYEKSLFYLFCSCIILYYTTNILHQRLPRSKLYNIIKNKNNIIVRAIVYTLSYVTFFQHSLLSFKNVVCEYQNTLGQR